MDQKNLTILIIIAVLFFMLGGGLAVLYQQTAGPQAQKNEAAAQTIKTLSSKVIPSIVAYGQVTNINGRNITLSYAGETVSVVVKEGSNVYSFSKSTDPKNNAPAQQKVSFETIKKGDNLNISLKLLPNGQIEGVSVIILPSSSPSSSLNNTAK